MNIDNCYLSDSDNYLYDTISEFFNTMINVSILLKTDGNKPLEKDIFKDIESIQYQAMNRTVYIQTKTFNYVLTEADGTLRLCEFYKRIPGSETQ